jgi:hypothetical protein
LGEKDVVLKKKILAAAKYTLNQYKIGDLPDKFKHISSFTNFVKNFKEKELDNIKVILSVPKKYKKVRSDFEDDFFNFDWQCSCGNIIDAWTINCQKCGATIDWRNRKE